MKKTKIKHYIFVMLVAGMICLPALAMSADVNVALNKAVTLNGSMNGALANTIVNGIFLPETTQWQSGSVWWNGLTPYAEINLNGVFQIKSFIVQADDNDAYLLQYHDMNTNTWKTAWNVPNYDAYSWGMTTRPNADQVTPYVLASSITTDMLRFYAVSGDNSYSVSEIQAYGAPVPLPAAIWLLGPGLLGLWRLRRKSLKA